MYIRNLAHRQIFSLQVVHLIILLRPKCKCLQLADNPLAILPYETTTTTTTTKQLNTTKWALENLVPHSRAKEQSGAFVFAN